MLIACVSDLHGHLPDIPNCDLLLLAGDLCPVNNHSDPYQLSWLKYEFRHWLEAQPARKIVGVAGNHDLLFQNQPHLVPELPWDYLEDSGTEFEGLKIYGTPHQPYFFDWAFNLYECDLEKKWAEIPLDTEILVLHGPPRGYGDLAPRQLGGTEHTGSPSLLARIDQLKNLKLAVFGHIHEGFGRYERNGAILANVSLVNSQYEPVNGVTMIEL